METDPKYFWIDRLKADPVWSKVRFKTADKQLAEKSVSLLNSKKLKNE